MSRLRWSPERKTEVAKQWAAGSSAAEIARTMPFDCTRNMVIGVVGRMGLQRSEDARRATNKMSRPGASGFFGNRPRIAKAKKATKVAKPERIPRSIREADIVPGERLPPLVTLDARLWRPLPNTMPKSLVDLRLRDCRWPVDVEDEILFCAAATAEGRSLCVVHHRWGHSQKPLAPLSFGKAA